MDTFCGGGKFLNLCGFLFYFYFYFYFAGALGSTDYH